MGFSGKQLVVENIDAQPALRMGLLGSAASGDRRFKNENLDGRKSSKKRDMRILVF